MQQGAWTAVMAAEDQSQSAGRTRSPSGRASSPSVPARLLYKRVDAAEQLAMSEDSFERYVQPHIKLVVKGRMTLVPHRELERWVSENAFGARGTL